MEMHKVMQEMHECKVERIRSGLLQSGKIRGKMQSCSRVVLGHCQKEIIMTCTYNLWYNMPGRYALEHKISIDAPSRLEAIGLARDFWDMLHKKGYYLQARP